MNEYVIVTKESNPSFEERVEYGSTVVVNELVKIAGTAKTVILEDSLYDSVVRHSSFYSMYLHLGVHCPVAKAFLLSGVWYVSSKEVSPFLIALDTMKNTTKEKQ